MILLPEGENIKDYECCFQFLPIGSNAHIETLKLE